MSGSLYEGKTDDTNHHLSLFCLVRQCESNRQQPTDPEKQPTSVGGATDRLEGRGGFAHAWAAARGKMAQERGGTTAGRNQLISLPKG